MTANDEATPTALLRQEHELILGVAGALSRILGSCQQSEGLAYDAVGDCITFFRLYADACHHSKEEDLLFPALADQGMPTEGGPVAVMLHEHELGRALVQTMAASIVGARGGDEADGASLRDAAEGFIELITAHIGKENNILFNMADQLIEGQACQDLCAAYDELSDARFEGHSKQDLETIAHTLLDKI